MSGFGGRADEINGKTDIREAYNGTSRPTLPPSHSKCCNKPANAVGDGIPYARIPTGYEALVVFITHTVRRDQNSHEDYALDRAKSERDACNRQQAAKNAKRHSMGELIGMPKG